MITPGGRVGDPSSLDRSPKKNWVEKRGGLPVYVRMVANALVRSGHDRSKAIAMAIAAMKRWAAGRGGVRPQVQAAAAKALAQWEAMKATTASGVETDEYTDVDLPGDIDRYAILDEESPMALHDGLYEEAVDDAHELASSLLAGAAPLHPPKNWFENPDLSKPTPLTLTSDGRVFGHIAAWNVDHIGIPGSRKPPRSSSNYAFFKTGVLRTEDGDDVPVGQITSVGGHAALHADAGSAVKHYDDTASAFADVNVGEDQHGIWVSGAVRPGVTEEQIRAIRASAPSGDWRPINGNLELVACCQVNVPGFPIVRSLVAGGEIQSLVAAGAAPLYALRQEEALVASIQAMENRMTRMEDEIVRNGLLASIDVQEEIAEVEDENDVTSELSTDDIIMLLDDAAVLAAAAPTSDAGREKLAKQGKALKDGSFPIPDVNHLKKAIQAIGRSKNPDAAKKLILKRAKALNAENLIPDSWKTPVTAAGKMTPLERMQSRRDDAKRMNIMSRRKNLKSN